MIVHIRLSGKTGGWSSMYDSKEYLYNELIKCSKQRDDLKRKLDDVVDLFNAHLHHKKAWSDNPYYDRVQQRLNKIMEDE